MNQIYGVAQVDRTCEVVRRCHEADYPLYEVADVAERPGLSAVPENGDGFSLETLDNEVRDHTAVVGVHIGPIRVEDPGHLDLQVMLAAVIEEQGLGAALPFIVTRPWPNGVDMSPAVFRLWMDLRVAVHLGGGRLEDLRLDPLGQAQHVDGAVDACLGGLDGIELVVDGRGRAGQVIDLIHLDVQGEGNVVAHQLEMGVIEERNDVVLGPGEEVVDAQNVAAVIHQSFAQMRADKTGAAGHQNTFTR